MAERIFTEQFCEMQKKTVCTTAEELNFDNYTDIGTYQIYVDAGEGQVNTYFLEVDKSTEGGCITQTRIGCGNVEKRYKNTAGKWTSWESADSQALRIAENAMNTALNAQASATHADTNATLANETAMDALTLARSNIIKGKIQGAVVYADDVSDISHKVNVKVKGENLDFSNVKITKTGRNVLSFTDSFTQTSNGITVSYDKTDGTFTINGKPNSNTINFGSNYLRRLLVGKGNAYTFSIEHISGSVVGEVFPNVFVGCADTQSGSNINWTNVKVNNENAIAYRSYGATGDWLRSMWLYTSPIESAPTFTDYKFRVCLEYGDTFTECVAPEITEHTPSADGTVKITSLAPTMTLLTDDVGVIIEAEYNRDSTKVIEKLTNAITALGGTV